MTVHDFRPRWRVGLHPFRVMSGVLTLAADLPSDVSIYVRSPCCHACSACASAPHLAQHLWLHANVHSSVQIACPEHAQPMAWRAFAGWPAAPGAVPPGHRIPVPSDRGKMQGKIKGCGTPLRKNRVCTWGWRGTRLIAARCYVGRQCLVGVRESACYPRLAWMTFDGVDV